MTLRVPVDFNTMDWDPQARVWINTATHPELAAALRPGLAVLLLDGDLEVEGTVEFDGSHPVRTWLARPDWSTSRDVCPP
jgi:hypothetical protein